LQSIGRLRIILGMPNRSRKTRQPDPAVMASKILKAVTGELLTDPPADSGKNPAAVALGRLGGLKGGKMRAKKLGKKKLSEAAKKAARARWGKR
jgi:hypothetical protein